MSIFSLVDVNNFYASCERVFNPHLEGKAIIVLSNNDGCVIARSNESKKLGIPMGAPFHEWKVFSKINQVEVFSSNYELYGDMSHRVMMILEAFCPDLEIYSIDEAFLRLDSLSHLDLTAYAEEIRSAIKMWTGLPVGIGVAPTKTLAKVANQITKKYLAVGVFDLREKQLQDQYLANFPVKEIWGVGRRIAARLAELEIHTALALRDSDEEWMRKKFSVVLERTIMELRAIPCLALEKPEPRKQIISSRSFGHVLLKIEEIEEALSHYVATACHKLRKQQSLTKVINVFLNTNLFGAEERQYANAVTLNLIQASNDTGYIISVAKKGLRQIFKKGYRYHKVGIILMDLIPQNCSQTDFFIPIAQPSKSAKLMQTIDSINTVLGRNSIQFCAEGLVKSWQLRCEYRSPRYTTRESEFKVVKCV